MAVVNNNPVLTWLDQRTGAVTALKDFLTEDVPGGASYWYTFGSATVFAMILQIATGIFLTFYYAPSAATAYESTRYIYDKVPLGWLVISLHYWGASAMIAFMAMHLLQVLIWGAYKKPRELQWIVGVILFLVTLVLGLTGYLLPWDLNAYAASKVAIQIAGSAPILGPATLVFLQDGSDLGTMTINRFFGIHVWLTPAILIGLVGMHLAIFRWNGAAGPPIDAAPKLKPGRFWPEQMFMDTVVSFGMFVVIFILAIVSPAPLDTKADPNNSTFVPFPAWYFLALFNLLNIVGQAPAWILPILDIVATIVIPGALVALMLALPFIDRNPSRRLSRRPIVLGTTAVILLIAIGLSLNGQVGIMKAAAAAGPSAPAAVAGQNLGAPAGAGGGAIAGAATAGTAGMSSQSGSTVAANQNSGAGKNSAGESIYASRCAGCHQANGAGMASVAPQLDGNSYVTGDTKPIIHTLLYGLQGPIQVNGKPWSGGAMPAWKGQLSNSEIASVITYIRSSWSNKAGPVKDGDVATVKQ